MKALGDALLFYASFDAGVDADFARGDGRLHTTPTGQMADGKPGLASSAIALEPAGRRFGGALRFRSKVPEVVYFRDGANLGYRDANWSGTVSLWLRCDPAAGLPPDFVDPLIVTDKSWDDASMFVDFNKREDGKPRPLRLGAFADKSAWNPTNRNFDSIPDAERPLIAAKALPFAAGRWTHVAITWDGFNRPAGSGEAVARLYLDGELAAELSRPSQSYAWDPARVWMRLGINYVGLLDDLAIFNRALDAGEVRALLSLPHGVADIRGR